MNEGNVIDYALSFKKYKKDYATFIQKAQTICPNRVFTSTLTTFAYGVDASCYSYTPKVVVWVYNELEVVEIIRLARACETPITFRAAGSSLSGQASSDSILIVANDGFKQIEILDNGKRIRLGCGVIGEQANEVLRPYKKKIGPDPATIATALIGGIVNNNSSGMCCGVEQNTYNTIDSIRVVLSDGTILDTSDEKSLESFLTTHKEWVDSLLQLRRDVVNNQELVEKIKRKYRIKNTTGFSINAILDFIDVREILNHIFIGSEGSLCFVSEVVLHCVDDYDNKSSGLLFYENLTVASMAITKLANLNKGIIAAAEIMDYACLLASQKIPEVSDILSDITEHTTCILLQTQHTDFDRMCKNLQSIQEAIQDVPTIRESLFSYDKKTCDSWWKIRKSLLPLAAKNRPQGSVVITEDVCFEIQNFCKGVEVIQQLFVKYNFHGIIFGHALAGNLHFIITPNLNINSELENFKLFMSDLAKEVVNLGGSIKAEHGTGRMVAPFVELEWGHDGYMVHRKIKEIFDSHTLLNPDVIITNNPDIHTQHFKRSYKTYDFIEHCMECGFCERACPSKFLTLTPRQRIAAIREITRLQDSDDIGDKQKAKEMKEEYDYYGVATCATCSMCKIFCPLDIDTANIANTLQSIPHNTLASFAYNNLSTTLNFAKFGLKAINIAQRVFDSKTFYAFSKDIHQRGVQLSKKYQLHRGFALLRFLPIFSPYTPKANDFFDNTISVTHNSKNAPSYSVATTHKVFNFYTPNNRRENQVDDVSMRFPHTQAIYFSTCINRTFRPSQLMPDKRPLQEVMESIAKKAGITLLYPKDIKNLCCGKPFSNYKDIQKESSLLTTLLHCSNNGKIPIIVDHSACYAHLLLEVSKKNSLYVLDSTEFIFYATQNLHFRKTHQSIAIHQMCALKKTQKQYFIVELSKKCSDSVQIIQTMECCGFAGYKGIVIPELNESSTKFLQSEIKQCDIGVSSSSTCEIGLSHFSQIPFQNIAYLVDSCID